MGHYSAAVNTAVLLGAVDYRAVVSQANHTGQAEGATEDILGQPLQSRRIAGRQVYAVVDTEAGMWPRSHQIDRFLIHLVCGQKQCKDIVLPLCQQSPSVDVGETDKRAAGCESTVGDDCVDMWMEVDQLTESLDPGNHTRD